MNAVIYIIQTTGAEIKFSVYILHTVVKIREILAACKCFSFQVMSVRSVNITVWSVGLCP
jgi:hypothetical protein